MICHRSSLIRQSCHFERDFDSVLLQLADTLSTQFKFREGSWHSLLKRFKCLRKSCAKFGSLLRKTYWILGTQLHVHLKKWTLNFKLLYLLNHMRYINKICRRPICGINPHLLTLQMWWIIYLLQFQRYRIFPRGLLFWRDLYFNVTFLRHYTAVRYCEPLNRSRGTKATKNSDKPIWPTIASLKTIHSIRPTCIACWTGYFCHTYLHVPVNGVWKRWPVSGHRQRKRWRVSQCSDTTLHVCLQRSRHDDVV